MGILATVFFLKKQKSPARDAGEVGSLQEFTEPVPQKTPAPKKRALASAVGAAKSEGPHPSPVLRESPPLSAENLPTPDEATLASEPHSSKSRILELYPEMKGKSLYDLLGAISVTDFPSRDGTFKNEGLASDGSNVVEYESTNGAQVTQWYSEDGQLGVEEIRFSGNEKITRWFSGGAASAQTVQYDNGKKGALLYKNDFGDPQLMRTWQSGDGPENRIEF